MNRTAEIATAREVDTRIAAAYDAFHAVNDKAIALRKSAASASRSISGYPERMRERIAERAASERARAAEIEAEAEPLRKIADDMNRAEYKGWNRFFLVKHIHNTQHCSSFRPTTRVGWLPDVSGLTEAEAVAEHGATLCTICFPSAPVELTTPAVDESMCPGSGKFLDASRLTGRENSYYSPAGTCSVCGERVALTARHSGKIRKHKR